MKKYILFLSLIMFISGCAQTTKNTLLKNKNSKQFIGHVFNTQQKNCLGNGELILIVNNNTFYIELNKISYNRKLVSYTNEGNIVKNIIKTNLDGYSFWGNISKKKIIMNYSSDNCKNDTITLKQKL